VSPAIVLTERELQPDAGRDRATREDRRDNDMAEALQCARAEAHKFGYAQSLSEKQTAAVACAMITHVSSTKIGRSRHSL
jgi:hypothetical protein